MDFAAKLVARLEEAVAETEERRSNLLFELGRYNGRLETLQEVLGLVNGDDTTAVSTDDNSSDDGGEDAAKTDSENGQSTA